MDPQTCHQAARLELAWLRFKEDAQIEEAVEHMREKANARLSNVVEELIRAAYNAGFTDGSQFDE